MKKLTKISIILLLIVLVSCTPTPSPTPAPTPVPSSNPTPTTSSTVTIGTQIWTTKNLDVSTYRNGDPIPQVQNPNLWSTLTTGAWCYYENNSANGIVYGKLYNWYAVNDPRGLAPIGYHIPTDADWTILTNYLGGLTEAGGKMKSTGNQFWNDPNNGATNLSGFSGLPGGYCGNNGTFPPTRINGYWWSSTLGTIGGAWFRSLGYNHASVFRLESAKGYGCSVRCIKD
jgi:uncharacterized protein (TIGR02145 family)